MKIIYLIFAVLAIALAFSYSQRVGALLLVVSVLGLWLTASKRGLLKA